jgi:hypothetical protein
MKKLLTTSALSLLVFAMFAQTQRFTSIKVENASKVFITQDSTWSVQNEGEGNSTNVKVVNDELILEGDGRSVYLVTLPLLKKITVDGIGNVTGKSAFTGDEIILDINGSGNVTLELNVRKVVAKVSGIGKITLSGSAEEAQFSVPGSGKVDAGNLKVKKCNASISGMGKCIVDVSDELNADISGTGSVTYKTMPKVLTQNITGMGKVKTADTTQTTGAVDTTKLDFGNTSVWLIKKVKKKSEDETAKPFWTGFELGLNSYMGSDNSLSLAPGLDDYELRQEKSIAAALNFYQKSIEIAKSNIWFVTGLGIHWSNYRFDNNVRLVNSDRTFAVRDSATGVRYLKSKLTTSYLTAPFMIQVLTSRNKSKAFHIGGGLLLGLRIGSHTKQKIEANGSTQKLKAHEDFNLRPLRYGFRFNIGYGKLNLFADYYASSLFKENKGPVLYPVTAGITLVGF